YAVPAAKGGAIAMIGPPLDHGMADIAAGEADRGEIRWLEGQQDHQVIVPTRHAPRPPAAPGPDHRRDIMDEQEIALTRLAQALRHAPGEAGAVDRHHCLRLPPPDI